MPQARQRLAVAMEPNVSLRERGVRIVAALGLCLVALDAYPLLDGTGKAWIAAALGALAIASLVTGATRCCPVYAAFGRRAA